jgi:hypothetical protein
MKEIVDTDRVRAVLLSDGNWYNVFGKSFNIDAILTDENKKGTMGVVFISEHDNIYCPMDSIIAVKYRTKLK